MKVEGDGSVFGGSGLALNVKVAVNKIRLTHLTFS